jgi:hypothetical protein
MNFTTKKLLVCLFLATNYTTASNTINNNAATNESIWFMSFKEDGDYYKNKKIITTDYDSKTEMRTIHCTDGTTHTFADPQLYLGGSKTSDIVERSSNPENQAVFRPGSISKDPKYNHQEVQTIYYADGHSQTFVHEGQVQLRYNDGEIRHKNCCNIN